MEEGFSYASFAGAIGVVKDTLYQWERKHPEFMEAKQVGFSKCRLVWEKMALDTMYESKGLNSTVWIFNMKNRFGWRDRIEQETTSTQEIKININEQDTELL